MSVTISGTTGISTIPDDIVTTDKILDANVTVAKLAGTVLDGYMQSELKTAQTASSNTDFNFTSIPAWANRVTVVFSKLSTNGTDDPLIQLGTGSGVVITGYLSTCTSITGTTAQTVASSTAGFVLNYNSAADELSGTYRFTRISGNTWAGDCTYRRLTTAVGYGAGDVALGYTLTSIRVTTTGGTDLFDGGTVSVLVEGYA